ncbi:MAG TPA: helix-turn-helix domain-containing protein [Streptosporangiaceae bacterium]|nr:helix-turn-helix domain-containing protein [Streptosporangiaceae bacterium]
MRAVDAVNRQDLAAFLRARRGRLRPAQVGLPASGRRRTPGLRRQEVAQVAAMSVDYYIRLEQARGPRPSRQVLAALARALLLTADEREYLYRLAGETPPPAPAPVREISPGIRSLLDSMPDTPAYVVDAKYDILAWNQVATHFIGDLSGFPDADRNMVRWLFGTAAAALPWPDEDAERFARSTVAELRAACARYPADRGIADLVTELLGTSSAFADMWAAQEVGSRRPLRKRLVHPMAGPLAFECQILHVGDTGQRLIAYCAAPGSATQVAFRRLAALRPAERVG